jgi:hypothetical protein
MHPLQPERAAAIVFLQGATDGAKHTLLLDEIRIENAAAAQIYRSLNGGPFQPIGVQGPSFLRRQYPPGDFIRIGSNRCQALGDPMPDT